MRVNFTHGNFLIFDNRDRKFCVDEVYFYLLPVQKRKLTPCGNFQVYRNLALFLMYSKTNQLTVPISYQLFDSKKLILFVYVNCTILIVEKIITFNSNSEI